jgi:hypothetical protein
MAKAQRYSLEQVQAAQKNLRCLAAKKVGKTRAETVELLAGDIRKAVEQGYSLKEIRDTLAKAGISAPLSRMKALLGQPDEEPAQTVAPVPETKAEVVPETAVTVPVDTGREAEPSGGKQGNHFDL